MEGSPPPTHTHTHTLPRLPKRLSLKKNEQPGVALFKLLRRVALSNRRAQPQTFYSLREVAQNFHLSVSRVSGVFLRLEEGGLLGKVRSSRTILHGRKDGRNLHVRGVVGLPVSSFRFSAFADYRALIIEVRRRLRRQGFMPAAVFFDRQEAPGGFVAERLLEARADAVIWFSPDWECQESVAVLRDAGARIVGVSDWVPAAIRCRYEIGREKALRAILQSWRAAGLISTVVVCEPRWRSAVGEERYRAASEGALLRSETVVVDESHLKRSLALLARRENQGILLTRSAAAFCALREPAALWELMQKRRVALLEGPINLLFAGAPAVPVDLIAVDWQTVAARIVSDLINQAVWKKSDPVLFHAAAHLRIPLNRYCHEI